ncbi:S15A2 protein, partial [Xiphorhynchus elegans]|nr:S15A2 protein [Xiphorhynchus elegans]
RFINGLNRRANVTIDNKTFIAVQGYHGDSEYLLMRRGIYNNGKCITRTGEFPMGVGLLDFGASYTVVITNISEGVANTWKLEDIKANSVHMAWQIPQYTLISAG